MNPMPRTLGILPVAITALFLVAYHGKEKPVPPSVPEPQAAPDSVDRKTYETIKRTINGLGNRTPSTIKDMMSFLRSYQKSHPEDAKEASKLIENLTNRK